MDRLPGNRQEMIDLIAGALDQLDDENDTPISEEQIALLASGRLDRLSEEDRARLLRQVARQPGAAQLVRQVAELDLDEGAAPALQEQAASRSFAFPRALSVAWAAAACLLLTLGMWRLADPPIDTTGPSGGIEQLDDPAAPPDFWKLQQQKKQAERADRDRVRDLALIGVAIVWVTLSGAIIVFQLRRRSPTPQT